MREATAVRLLPTLAIIAEELENVCPVVQAFVREEDAVYRGVRAFTGQKLRKDILYILASEDVARFPVREYAFVAPAPVAGAANYIRCAGCTTAQLLEFLQELFLDFQETESRINALAYENATLEQLCILGEELLENAICIHDNWFMVLAKSKSGRLLFPDGDTPWELIPQQFLDEFRMDAEYQRTYQHRRTELWSMEVNGRMVYTLYVNLYEKETYRGRLLISDTGRAFKKRDYIIAELLAQQALVLLKEQRHRTVTGSRGADAIMYDILNGQYTPAAEFSALMKTLFWEKNDRFLCIRIQRQEPIQTGTVDHILHQDLFVAFPGSYIMLSGDQQVVIINLNKTPLSLSAVRHILAPLCRDYYQYGGISSPVEGIRELPVAYNQAEEALNQAFRFRDEHWIIQFYTCALDYTLTHLNTPMQLRHLVAPQLLELMQYDREKGSQLFETFKAYINNERDIPKTAAQLIIHRTTLTYRLKKIHAMMDMNLEDPNVRLYLQLSLKMLEQEKTVKLSKIDQA